jgi:hypothetical protein
MNRAAQLEKQINVLIEDSVALLKARMAELGINATTPGDLLAKAKEIVLRHKELQAKANRLQQQVKVNLLFIYLYSLEPNGQIPHGQLIYNCKN